MLKKNGAGKYRMTNPIKVISLNDISRENLQHFVALGGRFLYENDRASREQLNRKSQKNLGIVGTALQNIEKQLQGEQNVISLLEVNQELQRYGSQLVILEEVLKDNNLVPRRIRNKYDRVQQQFFAVYALYKEKEKPFDL